MFKSIKDLKLLSLATLLDVLTTTISDLNVGKTISSTGKGIVEKTATTLTWLSRSDSDTNDNIVIDIDPEEVSCLGTLPS